MNYKQKEFLTNNNYLHLYSFLIYKTEINILIEKTKHKVN
jgi:hypothetical protein